MSPNIRQRALPTRADKPVPFQARTEVRPLTAGWWWGALHYLYKLQHSDSQSEPRDDEYYQRENAPLTQITKFPRALYVRPLHHQSIGVKKSGLLR